MDIAGYIASALIGISLGLIGGGGSILTVPVLVYLFGITPTIATSYSLFVVGSTSLVGAFRNYQKGMVSIKTAFMFGASSIVTVFLTRKFLIPAIPKTVFTISGYAVTSAFLTMVLFALLMVVASVSMIKSRTTTIAQKDNEQKSSINKLMLYGVGVGLVTGLLGAGGGFLLIPALVLLVKLPMKKAIGTSLLIIAANSLIGFVGDVGHFAINWTFLLTISAIAIAGIFLGTSLSKKIEARKLRKGFGWFVLVMGIYIIIKEVFLT